MTEINAEREKNGWGKRTKDAGLRFGRHIFSVGFGHIRTAVETEVRGKHISKNRCTLRIYGRHSKKIAVCLCFV